MDGVRLLSHRPSVLYKIEHLATEPAAGDISVEGLLLAGPGWDDRLKTVVKTLSGSERACLFAVRLADEQSLPVLAETLLDRARTDWFPEFLSHGQMKPHFQPIVDLTTGRAFGREALMRGMLGTVELRGAELVAAAEAHDALFSFDYRARTAALEIGLPLLPEGEILFVNLDPRAVLDVEARCARPGRSSAARRRPLADLHRDHPPRALPGPRPAARDGPGPPQARRARRPRRPPAAPTRWPASSCCVPTSPRSTWR